MPNWKPEANALVIFSRERDKRHLLCLRARRREPVEGARDVEPGDADVALYFLRHRRVRELSSRGPRPVHFRLRHDVEIRVVAAPRDVARTSRTLLDRPTATASRWGPVQYGCPRTDSLGLP